MVDRHRPNTPGGYYRSAANKKLVPYKVDLEPDTLTTSKEAAARAGMSQRQATEYVDRTFAREHGVDVPAHPGPNGSKPPSLDCYAITERERERNAQSAASARLVQWRAFQFSPKGHRPCLQSCQKFR
jgi:hypothetical protein